MLKFTAYIEYILMTRHYCYVPGHGAYMLSDEPATEASVPAIGASSSRLYPIAPPRRILRFSAFHTHDDGILANLLMEAEGMTYDEACRYIERQVPLLSEDFIDEAMNDIDTDNYGFDEIRIETWKDIETRLNPPVVAAEPKVTPQVSADTIAIPKVWLKRVAMIAMVAVFFFTNFIGLNPNDEQQIAAVFNLPAWTQAEADPSADIDDEDNPSDFLASLQPVNAIVPTDAAPVAVTPSVPTQAAVAAAPAQPAVAPAPAQPVAQAPSQPLDRYYIIIASTVSREEAEAVSLRYARQGYTEAGVLVCGNLYRVFAQSFNDRDEASAYLHSLRTSNERLAKSWLFTLSDPSLSSIIKNKYNDNQLSMELSHPNTRTERDQG